MVPYLSCFAVTLKVKFPAHCNASVSAGVRGGVPRRTVIDCPPPIRPETTVYRLQVIIGLLQS